MWVEFVTFCLNLTMRVRGQECFTNRIRSRKWTSYEAQEKISYLCDLQEILFSREFSWDSTKQSINLSWLFFVAFRLKNDNLLFSILGDFFLLFAIHRSWILSKKYEIWSFQEILISKWNSNNQRKLSTIQNFSSDGCLTFPFTWFLRVKNISQISVWISHGLDIYFLKSEHVIQT